MPCRSRPRQRGGDFLLDKPLGNIVDTRSVVDAPEGMVSAGTVADLDDLHAALAAQDWPTALDHALLAWRGSREPALADLIDRITARCELPVRAGTLPKDHQLWWVECALAKPDPLTVAALLAMLDDRADYLDAAIETVRKRWAAAPQTPLAIHLGSSNRWPTNFQDRSAILLDWPDDPRVATAVVDAVRSTRVPHAHGVPALYDELADRVAEIGDVRVIDKLTTMAAEPRGGHDVLRRLQIAFATRALAGFANRKAPRERVSYPAAQIASCIALLPASPPPPPSPAPRVELEALWREVSTNPDDIGTRAVLGDALVEAGDLRGDIIVLQCNARRSNRPLRSSNRTAYDGRVKTLLRMQWEEWFGDLALVLPRRACEFRCGMLEVATIGYATSPDWAFAKARDHRELACVHTVRPGWITPANFATFVTALPRFPHTLAVTGLDVIEALIERGATFERVHTFELERSNVTGPQDRPLPDWTAKPLREQLARVATLVPGLRHLIVRDHTIARMFVSFRREVRLLFPALQQLAVDEPTALIVRALVDDNTFTLLPTNKQS